MDLDRERHYQQAMKVAQAAWDFVNPPQGERGSERIPLYDKLNGEVHKLRRLELELAQNNNLHAALYGTDQDLITDHPFTPATFRDAWPGICGWDVDGWPCGYAEDEHVPESA